MEKLFLKSYFGFSDRTGQRKAGVPASRNKLNASTSASQAMSAEKQQNFMKQEAKKLKKRFKEFNYASTH